MDDHLEKLVMGWFGKQVGTVKVLRTQERGNKPYRQVEDKQLWFRKA